METTSIVAIVVICGLAAQVVKATALDNKWLPVICGLFGAVLGVVGMYVVPGFPAEDILTAVSVGITSGLSATGLNQAYKQLKDKPAINSTSDTDRQNK